MVASMVSMSGHVGRGAVAVWIGYAIDPNNPKRALGAELFGVFGTKREALDSLEAFCDVVTI